MINSKSTFFYLPIIVSFLFFGNAQMNAQKIAVTSGIGLNSFIDFKKNSSHSFANYKSGTNQFVKVDFIALLPEMNFLDFSFKLEKSTGAIETRYSIGVFCGVGFTPPPSSDMNAEFELYRMAVDVIPLNISLYKKLKLRGGIELSRLFRKKTRDLNLELRNNTFSGLAPLLPEDSDLFRKFGIGFHFELHFGEFQLNNTFSLSPLYTVSVSWFDEIKTNFDTKSMRHSLGVSVRWGVNSVPLKL